MKVLLIGSGGREHALGKRLVEDGATLHAAPGNPGLAQIGICHPVAVDDLSALTELAQTLAVDLVVVGPELPLTLGLADKMRAAGIPTFGPGKVGAELEASKSFAKAFMQRHQIPTARSERFDDVDAAHRYLEEMNAPYVIKADGLAAGKGVVVTESLDEAKAAAYQMLEEQKFGEAGSTILVEEYLNGEELSLHVLFDGHSSLSLDCAQDHKRALEGDKGLNTGGMGAYSPTPLVDDALWEQIQTQVVDRTIEGLKVDKIEFQGVIFIGLMIVDGKPYVLEYNVRFGDPETEVLMPRLGGSVVSLLNSVAASTLSGQTLSWRAPHALCVVLTSAGYPLTYQKGRTISGVEDAAGHEGVYVYHAGTKDENDLRTNGGRVLAVTGVGQSLKEASDRAYSALSEIIFDGKTYRRDIGWRAKQYSHQN